MRTIGFSTGSLALGDFKKALCMLYGVGTKAVELSALRKHELKPLFNSLNGIDLSQFSYVSVHAPSKYEKHEEEEIVKILANFVKRNWPVIVHPDSVYSWDLWRQFGHFLFIENMDKRKPIARDAVELEDIFKKAPEAKLCFDIGHARQLDNSMGLALNIVKKFKTRLGQIHLSEVGPQSQHLRISLQALSDFQKISENIPKNIPVILETPVNKKGMIKELFVAESSLCSYNRSIIKKIINNVMLNKKYKENEYHL